MHKLASSALAATALLLATDSWSAPAGGFTYWGVGLEAQEFGVDLDLSALSSNDPETADRPGVDNAFAFGTRFFAGYQFINGFTLEAGAFGGVTPIETINSQLQLARRKEFAIHGKAGYTFALSDYAFARAHVGTRFYTRQSFTAVAPADEDSGWSLTQNKLATSDLTAGLGLGFAWGAERAVLMEYEALQREEQALHSLSLSLMIRL